MKLAKLENQTVVNTILCETNLPGYVMCPDEVGIGWISTDGGITFNAPVESEPPLENYKDDALSRVTSFEDEQLKDLLGKSLGHKTVAALIRFIAAEAYNAGTATAGQTAYIENEASQKGLNPATMASNAASNYASAQGLIGNLKGIIDVATTAINNATNIAEVDLAVASAIEAWNEL